MTRPAEPSKPSVGLRPLIHHRIRTKRGPHSLPATPLTVADVAEAAGVGCWVVRLWLAAGLLNPSFELEVDGRRVPRWEPDDVRAALWPGRGGHGAA
jgi:hypothetical protein